MKLEILAAVHLAAVRLVVPVRLAAVGVATATFASAVLAAPAVAQGLPIATTPLEGLRLAAGESIELELDAPLPARSLGLWWRGDLGEAWFELLDPNGAGLGVQPIVAAHDLAPDVVGLDRPAGAASVSGLTHAYGGPAAGARLTLVGPTTLSGLTVVWIGPGATPLQPTPLPVAAGAGYPKPFIYDRASWGALAPQCGVSYCNTTHVALHHSASSADFQASTWSQAAANVQSIQAYHMFTNGWCDVGYNYLISKQGWIFEGRAGGDDVKGAHDGKNCGSMGVCVMGYFHPPVNNAPTAALLEAFGELAAWKCDQQGIDPTGSAFYAGLGAVEQTLYGHRDVSATACPGDSLYAELPALRADVDGKLSGGVGTSGTLKGVLYDATLGIGARIAGGTVALSDGTFTTSASDGYWEFPLPAGTYPVAATAPGYRVAHSSETVTGGDVWESLGLVPSPGSPTLVVTPLAGSSFASSTGASPSSAVWLGYAGVPGIPPVPFGAAGDLWPHLATLQTVYLGSVGGSGVLNVNLQVSGAPSGLTLHLQCYVLTAGQARLTNGAAWQAP
ncbi:N-acetylmuramoyl-L-alanine amidase [Engelhardtia mirabilis]|uniref:N-acetylmuramoyl-L-alanine amidase n=1 Tax=Engelhardtia mirabilis TaxID=2528011 RepID=A0A518BM93_9BACT|nr:N-acetylmuramoyl-L-alanine amidase [Planctomycetes bacterium Pla133]QDV02427.1 N-acetylmuramoyl-L-alanine amidase [Planctomycetes bacterium Pla86]